MQVTSIHNITDAQCNGTMNPIIAPLTLFHTFSQPNLSQCPQRLSQYCRYLTLLRCSKQPQLWRQHAERGTMIVGFFVSLLSRLNPLGSHCQGQGCLARIAQAYWQNSTPGSSILSCCDAILSEDRLETVGQFVHPLGAGMQRIRHHLPLDPLASLHLRRKRLPLDSKHAIKQSANPRNQCSYGFHVTATARVVHIACAWWRGRGGGGGGHALSTSTKNCLPQSTKSTLVCTLAYA